MTKEQERESEALQKSAKDLAKEARRMALETWRANLVSLGWLFFEVNIKREAIRITELAEPEEMRELTPLSKELTILAAKNNLAYFCAALYEQAPEEELKQRALSYAEE